MEKAEIMGFPFIRGKQKNKRIRAVDGIKYFSPKHIKLLRPTARDQEELSRKKRKITGIR